MQAHITALNSRDQAAIAATLREATKLSGTVEVAEAGTLPNDGKVIADERDYAG